MIQVMSTSSNWKCDTKVKNIKQSTHRIWFHTGAEQYTSNRLEAVLTMTLKIKVLVHTSGKQKPYTWWLSAPAVTNSVLYGTAFCWDKIPSRLYIVIYIYIYICIYKYSDSCSFKRKTSEACKRKRREKIRTYVSRLILVECVSAYEGVECRRQMRISFGVKSSKGEGWCNTNRKIFST